MTSETIKIIIWMPCQIKKEEDIYKTPTMLGTRLLLQL
jgi:hypothetical protein